MRLPVYAAVTVTLLAGCREKPTALAEPLLLSYYAVPGDRMCDNDSAFTEENRRGSLFLTEHSKALFSIRTSDTIHYYRGTYSLIENGVLCSFDGKYDYDRKAANKKKKNGAARIDSTIVSVQPWNLNLQKSGCSDFVYFSESGNNPRTHARGKMAYRETEGEQVQEYLARITSIPALRDFHLAPTKALKQAGAIPAQVLAQVISHYESEYKKNTIIKKTETDSTVKLTFSYKRVPPGESAEPFLYMTLSKNQRKALSGDLDGDGINDLIVQPRLSQGGNSAWRELFVFLKKGNDFEFKTSASCYDLAQYKGNSHSGHFIPKEISNGELSGTSVSYRDDDAACCPSVKVGTTVRLVKNRLVSSRMK